MKHTIRKHISRKVNTGSYENITISVDIEKEFECSEEEFTSISSSMTGLIISDFENTFIQVMEELKLSEKKAWADPAPIRKEKMSEDEMKDILGE